MANIKSFPNNQDEYIGAEYVMKWLHGRTSGVFAAENNAAVSAVQNEMAVNVSDGLGWIANIGKDGVVWWIDHEAVNGTKQKLAIDAADSTLNRIDRIIVEWKTTNYVDYPEVKVLKGSLSSTAVAPVLTNNSTVRQISLAQVYVAAGTTAITASMVTDERMDASVCGIVTEYVEVDTSMMDAQFKALLQETQEQTTDLLVDTQNQTKAVLDAIQKELAGIEAGVAVELRKLQFNDTVVPVSAFVDDTTYADFPYRAAVALDGVIASMIPEVILGLVEATDGNFAPVAQSYNGGVYLYAASPPESAVTVPTIICWKGNA
jgi:hypothetical protein